jgi:hypothetical protein
MPPALHRYVDRASPLNYFKNSGASCTPIHQFWLTNGTMQAAAPFCGDDVDDDDDDDDEQ